MDNVSPTPKSNLTTVGELCNAPRTEQQYPHGRVVVDFDGSKFARVKHQDSDSVSGPEGRWIIGFHGFDESYMTAVPDSACVINPSDRGAVATMLREYVPIEDVDELLSVLMERKRSTERN